MGFRRHGPGRFLIVYIFQQLPDVRACHKCATPTSCNHYRTNICAPMYMGQRCLQFIQQAFRQGIHGRIIDCYGRNTHLPIITFPDRHVLDTQSPGGFHHDLMTSQLLSRAPHIHGGSNLFEALGVAQRGGVAQVCIEHHSFEVAPHIFAATRLGKSPDTDEGRGDSKSAFLRLYQRGQASLVVD